MPEPLWTVQEVSEYLGVHVKTVYRWAAGFGGPPGIKLGKYVRFRPEDVAEWVEAHRLEQLRPQ